MHNMMRNDANDILIFRYKLSLLKRNILSEVGERCGGAGGNNVMFSDMEFAQ